MIKMFWKLFLYAGVEKEEYYRLLPSVRKENEVLLGVFSPIAGVMFYLLFIVSMLTRGFATVNSTTYLISGILMSAIFLCVHRFLPKHPGLVMVLVYVFEIILYIFGIRISMLHAHYPAVSAVAFLLVSPLLFYDRPARLSALIAAVAAAFCVLCCFYKQPSVAQTDVWNTVTFGIVAIVTTVFIMSIKYRALAQSRKIEYMGQTDLLTGAKNRNHFENQIQEYTAMGKSGMICVYGDVNGLHEVNNKEGHQAGDRMLQEVAAKLRECFGPEHTYRVGGDEFVAFVPDRQPEKVRSDLDQVRQALDKEGYHVSFGMAVQETSNGALNMHKLVKEAEDNMFSAKRDYYLQPEHNRRTR